MGWALLCLLTEINYCESSPCANGGSCESIVNGYVCHCQPGYTGDHCEHGEHDFHLESHKIFKVLFVLGNAMQQHTAKAQVENKIRRSLPCLFCPFRESNKFLIHCRL